MTSSSVASRRDERKLVTILFADLVGSTDLGERLDPERLQAMLQTYFGAMTAVIERWGGTVEKYIGDAIMAVFGVPRIHEDDARRAVGAALDMLFALDRLNPQFLDRYGVQLKSRIGVNTGDVLAPVGGPAEQMLVVGDAVNVAARLEQAADPGTVLVGERTHAATAQAFSFAEPRDLELRGKSRPVPAWQVDRWRDPAANAPIPVGSPIVGRERERRLLADALDEAVQAATPRTVVVFGSAGVGKSRLAREAIADALRERPAAISLRGRCLAAGNGITYWALGEIVRQAFDITLDEAPGVTGERLEGGVRRDLATSGLNETDVQRTIHALATSAGIRLDGNPLDQLRPVVVVEELALAWPRYLSARSSTNPLIVLIEDLHWADDQLLEILESIRSRSVGPLLVLATARPEFQEDHPAFGVAREGSVSVALRPLALDDAGGILDNLGGKALPDPVRQQILDRAEGNPFFLEQLVGGLVDSRVLVHEGSDWTFNAGGGDLALPDTIHGVLASRIDRLEPGDKLVLQEAAVVGRAFWPAAVALGLDEADVGRGLRSLEAKGLITVRPTSALADAVEYAFRHALILDVAYASIPMGRRGRSHAAIAEWLEGLTSGTDEALVELIAHHYRSALLGEGSDLAWADDEERRAAVKRRAFPAIVAAGALARKRNAIARAIELHTAALALAESDADLAQVHEELGDDHGWGYHGDPSVEAWNRALDLRRALGDGEAIARIAVKMGRSMGLYWGGFAQRPSGETLDRYVDEGLAHATSPETRAWLLAIRARAVEAWAADGRPDPVRIEDRLGAAEEAVALARETGDPTLQIVARRTLTNAAGMSGDDARALALAREELATLTDAALRDRIISMHQAAAVLMDVGGEIELARGVFAEAHALTRDRTAHERMHASYFLMAALYRLARWGDIEPLALEHLRTYDEEEVDIACPYTRSGPVIAAIVMERLGRTTDVEAADHRIVPNPERPGLVEAWIAERALRRGNPAEARRIGGSIVRFRPVPILEEPPYEQPVLVETIGLLGDDPAHAAEILASARSRASRVAWLAPAIDRAEGLSSLASGNGAAARAPLERALRAYRALGMPREIADLETRLSSVAAGS